MSLSLDDALPDKRAARRAFDRARDFSSACFIHDEARGRLLERLDLIRLDPLLTLDVGCATGRGATALAARYPAARVLAIDSSSSMLRSATKQAASSVALLEGDAERLPLRSHCADLLLANLVLPWCRPDRVFAESARVLAWLREHGIRTVATTPAAEKVYSDVDLRGPLAVIMGSEQYGLSEFWLKNADVPVRIPMAGQADSLNVAMATIITLFEAVRQRGG